MATSTRTSRRCANRPCRNWTRDTSGTCHLHRTSAPPPAPVAPPAAATTAPFHTPNTTRATTSRQPRIHVAHANDAVLPPDQVDLDRIAHLAGRDLITIDMDGTVFGRELCHPLPRHHPDAFAADDDCDHARHDVIARIRDRIGQTGATPVVLSWRAGHHQPTERWLAHIGLDTAATFVPGAPADCAGLELDFTDGGTVDHQASRRRYGTGQVAYKAATIAVLQRELGCRIVDAYDDNPKVIAGLQAAGATAGTVIDVPGRTRRCSGCNQPFDPVNVIADRADPTRCTDCVWPAPHATATDWPTKTGWTPPAPPGDPLGTFRRPDWMPAPHDAADRDTWPF